MTPNISRPFATIWLAILGTSVYDGLWVFANRGIILTAERNPVGLLLLNLNGGDIWLLLGIKAMGTVAAGAVLLVLYWTWPRAGWTACVATLVIQLGLVVYLIAS